MTVRRTIRSWLYVPGNNAHLQQSALRFDVDAIVLDLEDSVPPDEKGRARELVRDFTQGAGTEHRADIWVRVNGLDTPFVDDDIKAVVVPGLAGIRLPKVEDPEAVSAVAARLAEYELQAGMQGESLSIVCGIESAVGVDRAREIAVSSRRVHALAFGAADFCADLGAEEDERRSATLVARSLLALASRQAGIAPPIDSVYTAIDDDEGLRRTTLAGKALGFFGRGAIHPRQLDVIHQIFTPTASDVAHAQAVVQAARESGARGAIRMRSGEFVDLAIMRRAEALLDLAERLGSLERPS